MCKTLVKLFLLVCFLSVNSCAVEKLEQRTIQTVKDYRELESNLKKIIKFGDKSKLIALATLYLKKFELSDGVIKKREALSRSLLNKALNEGYGMAALMLFKNEPLDSKLLLLERGLKSSKISIGEMNVLAVTYNSIILDYKHNNIRYVKKALNLTYGIAESSNSSALDFTIANLLNLAGAKEKANQYLNTACNNPNISNLILDSCRNSIGITENKNKYEDNIEKTKTCETCGVLK